MKYLIKIFIFFNNLFLVNGFQFNSNIINNVNILKQNKKIYMINQNEITNKVVNSCPEYLDKFTKLLDQEQSESLVKGVTGFLTKVDGFGGYVLHSNDVLINCILNNDFLPLENKKDIILFFIKLSQYGDSTGSHILQFYHDLVSCLL
jgi:glucose-6-phosphate isomerase